MTQKPEIERGGGGGGREGMDGWRERERERERERDRDRDRQTDRQTDTDRQTQTERERESCGAAAMEEPWGVIFFLKLDNLTIEKLQPPITVTAFDQLGRGGGGAAGTRKTSIILINRVWRMAQTLWQVESGTLRGWPRQSNGRPRRSPPEGRSLRQAGGGQSCPPPPPPPRVASV